MSWTWTIHLCAWHLLRRPRGRRGRWREVWASTPPSVPVAHGTAHVVTWHSVLFEVLLGCGAFERGRCINSGLVMTIVCMALGTVPCPV